MVLARRFRVLVAVSIACFSTLLAGCEGHFAGSKAENSEIYNGPFQMKILKVMGQNLLVLLNTNFQFKTDGGSLQFYSLTNPALPVKAAGIASLKLPSNVSDFEIIDGPNPVLLVCNRNTNELWVYDMSGGTFTRRLDAKGAELVVKTPTNPTGLLQYNRTSDGALIIAITSQRAGTVSLLDYATLTYVDPRKLGLTTYDAVQVIGADIFGAKYYMTPRQSQVAGEDDNLGVTGSRRLGVGITRSLLYGTADDIIVSYNALQNGLHSFRFGSFLNAANLSWELTDYRKDFTLPSGATRVGTDEEGFRGMDIDSSKNIYLSSRTDNSIYIVPAAEIVATKNGDQNTKGFAENNLTYRLPVQFDPVDTDDVFPRLGDLAVEKDGSKLWVLGLGTDSLYRVDITAKAITHQSKVGSVPQRLLAYPPGGPYQYIYVANTKGDSLSVVDATTMTILQDLKNP